MFRPAAALTLSFLVSLSVYAGEAESRRVLVRARGHLSSADRAALGAAGLEIGRPVPGGGFLARVGAGFRGDPRIESIVPLRAAHKIDPSARREAARAKPLAELRVFFHDDIAFDDARAAILALGGSLDGLRTKFGYTRSIAVGISGSRLEALAGDDRVKAVIQAPKGRPSSANANAAALSHVTELLASPYDLDGQGVTVSAFEVVEGTGAQTTHPDFGGRVTNDVVSPGNGSWDLHATHIAGTIGGTGGGAWYAKGMAPASRIHIFEVYDDFDDTLASKTSARELGAAADNNSWLYPQWKDIGGYWTWYEDEEYIGTYDRYFAGPLDSLAIGSDVLYVFCAGNHGQPPALPQYGVHRHFSTGSGENWCYWRPTCPAPCSPTRCVCSAHPGTSPWTTTGSLTSGKNTLVVGATTAIGSMASFSSRGPTADGRIKPDVVARGAGLHSTAPVDAYGNLSGTSMSSAVATGIAALLTQQWRRTFGGADPPPVSLKTLMIAGADDVVDSASQAPAGPDYVSGYGLLNAKASADLIREDGGAGARIRSSSLDHGQRYEVDLTVSAPQNLRIVLGWFDPPAEFLGNSNTTDPALVNDLDVVVIAPSGAVIYPYVLDRNTPWVAATRAANHIDNTEMIELANAAAGTYRVVVTGTNVVEGPQRFVLIANAPVGNAASSPLLLSATGSGTPSVSLSWNSVGNGTLYDVYSRSAPGPFTLRASNVSGSSYVDSNVTADSAYLYQVVARFGGGGSVTSNVRLATTIAADGLASGNPVRYAHIQALSATTNSLRAVAGLGGISFSNTPTSGGPVYASHLSELRAAIASARSALQLPAAAYSRDITSGQTISASDFIETRAGLQ